MTSSPPAIVRLLSGWLHPGMVLNLGAAATGSTWRPGSLPINLDVVIPPLPAKPFVRADAVALPFPAASFDGVLAKDVLEHVTDVHAAMREIRRTLRPNARLVATVPRAVPRAVWADPTHLRGFTKKALVVLLRQHDLEVELVRKIGAVPGAGRLHLERHLVTLLRMPGLGHLFGTNWLAVARVC